MAIKDPKECALSTSEAKNVALSEAVKELTFIFQLLRSMKISIKLPVTVRVENVGTIFIASTITTTSCTKHVDIKYKYVNKYIQDGVVKMFLLSLLIMTATFSPRT